MAVNLKFLDSAYQLITTGKDGKKVTLEQLEKDQRTKPVLDEIRKELTSDDEGVYPALMTACLQGKRDRKTIVDLITSVGDDGGTGRRDYRMRLLEGIEDVAEACGIDKSKRVYDKRWAIRLCEEAEKKTSDGVSALKGSTLEELVSSFQENSGLRGSISMVRGWAAPRPRQDLTSAATPPPASGKPSSADDDPLAGLL